MLRVQKKKKKKNEFEGERVGEETWEKKSVL